MNIGIIGAGSIGLLYSYYLSKFHHITLYTKRQDQAIAIEKNGVSLHRGEDTLFSKDLNATDTSDYAESFLIVTVKQYQLEEIIMKFNTMEPKTILFIQNGMGHLEHMSQLKQHQVYLGVVEHGSLKISDTSVRHTGIGRTKYARYPSHSEESKDLSHIFLHEDLHFPYVYLENWEEMLKEKLIVNAIVNPLTSLLQVKNGELIKNPLFNQIGYDLYLEVISILEYEYKKETLWLHIQEICASTAENESSMYKDIQQERPTEIDAIVGFLLKNAGDRSVPIIEFLFKAIKGKESQYRREES